MDVPAKMEENRHRRSQVGIWLLDNLEGTKKQVGIETGDCWIILIRANNSTKVASLGTWRGVHRSYSTGNYHAKGVKAIREGYSSRTTEILQGY